MGEGGWEVVMVAREGWAGMGVLAEMVEVGVGWGGKGGLVEGCGR